MFLNKKAEETFINFVKQAKEIMEGESKFSKIVNFIKNNEITKAVEDFDKLAPLDKMNFKSSKEFQALTREQQEMFEKSQAVNETAQQLAEEKKPTEEPKKEDKKEEEEAPLPEAEPVDKEPATDDVALGDLLGEEKEPSADGEADLASVPKASIFEYVTKKADFEEDVDPVMQANYFNTTIDESLKDSVRYYIGAGMDKQEAVNKALEVCDCDDSYHRQIAEDVANSVNTPKNIEDHTARVTNMLDAINSYKPEESVEEQIGELAKSSASAYEFLNKLAGLSKEANKLDEIKGAQYPGQKLFDDIKQTSFDGGFGVSPQHPGPKVLSTRLGGNPPVESNFQKAGKPEVDVYDKKSDKKDLTSISSMDGTIAFMQPIPFEKNVMGETADYTGFVTGTMLQKEGNPEAAGPVAEAGHKTENYLDKVMEEADKKEPAEKKASDDFAFYGITKQASDVSNDISNVGGSGLDSDGSFDTKQPEKAEEKKKTLTEDELVEARKLIKEREDNITRANSMNSELKVMAAAVQSVAAFALLEDLKTHEPSAYKAIEDAARLDDLKAFETVFKQTMITNLKQSHENLDDILSSINYAELKEDMNPNPEPAEPEKPEGEDKGEKPEPKEESGKGSEEKDSSSDDAAVLEDLLGGK